jgi:hypothetical protein
MVGRLGGLASPGQGGVASVPRWGEKGKSPESNKSKLKFILPY